MLEKPSLNLHQNRQPFHEMHGLWLPFTKLNRSVNAPNLLSSLKEAYWRVLKTNLWTVFDDP